jgi:hypothetical protein
MNQIHASELTLADLATLQNSPVARELAELATQIDEEQAQAGQFMFNSAI